MLARLLVDLNELPNVDLSLAGFEDDEIPGYLKKLEAKEKRHQVEDFDVVKAIDEAKKGSPLTEPGDLWQLGEHRLQCGEIPPRIKGAGLSTMTWAQSSRDSCSKPASTSLLIQTVQSTSACRHRSCTRCKRPSVKREGTGQRSSYGPKDTFTVGRADYQRQYEPILYGWRERVKHQWHGGRSQGDLWMIDKPHINELHPTMKPLALVERTIENSSSIGDIVLDPFLGSGTTLIASERTGRTCYGMELDPHYCDVIVARWETFTRKKAERETT